MKLGVSLNSLGLGVKEAIGCAAKSGLRTIDVDATCGEITSDLSYSGRRDFLRYVGSYGLGVSALGGDFGRPFSDEDVVEQLFDKTTGLIELATGLKVKVVTVRIGRVPVDEKDRVWAMLREVLNELGRRAERYEIHLASHVGESSPADMKKMLDSLGTQGVRACYDPSILIPMGLDAVEGVRELGSCIVHAYARDILKGERGYVETIPGQGIVPFRDYVLALLEAGYDGHFIIRREAGEGSVEDVIKAREFLEKLIVA